MNIIRLNCSNKNISREVEQLQRDMAEHTAQKRKEAEESVRLMTEFVQRKLDAEAAKNGIFLRVIYFF